MCKHIAVQGNCLDYFCVELSMMREVNTMQFKLRSENISLLMQTNLNPCFFFLSFLILWAHISSWNIPPDA